MSMSPVRRFNRPALAALLTVLVSAAPGHAACDPTTDPDKTDIANFPVLSGVKAITVLVDRGDPAALDGAMECIKRYVEAGRGARWLRTVRVKDFNDLVMS